MSKIVNNPSIDEEIINVNRAAIEHRATWMGLIYDEMVKAGVEDAEAICRKAIKRCGLIHGEKFKNICAGSKDCRVFGDAFANELGVKTFEMTPSRAENELHLSFHYCPLVAAWKKLGFSDERIALLCDIAMDGDRGIAEANELKFNLGDTIASGCATCEVNMSR